MEWTHYKYVYKIHNLTTCSDKNYNFLTGAEYAPSIFGVDDGKTLPQLSEFLMSEFKGHKNCVLWYNQKQKVQKVVDSTVNNVAAESSIYVSLT